MECHKGVALGGGITLYTPTKERSRPPEVFFLDLFHGSFFTFYHRKSPLNHHVFLIFFQLGWEMVISIPSFPWV